MSDFVQTMKDWRRMCNTMDTLYGDKCCDVCSLGGCCAVYEQDGTEDYAEIERKVMEWAKENPEPVYPTWWKYLCMIGVIPDELGDKTLGEMIVYSLMNTPIYADIAQKLGIEPKEG